MMKIFGLLVFLLVACGVNTREHPANNRLIQPIVWHWEDEFSQVEKDKLILYLTEVTQASFNVLGKYPFQMQFYLHRSKSEREPIPWAHTERSEVEAVHFYVNPSFDLSVFRADWTAPHEISHLSIPFLGKANAWFSEGYATYMQLQIMKEMGIYTSKEILERYKMKDNLVKGDFSSETNFVDEAKRLRETYNYPAMYWGSVRFFKTVDRLLQTQEHHSLTQHIKAYQNQNRLKDETLDDVLHSLDAGLKAPIFQKIYQKCCTSPFDEAFD